MRCAAGAPAPQHGLSREGAQGPPGPPVLPCWAGFIAGTARAAREGWWGSQPPTRSREQRGAAGVGKGQERRMWGAQAGAPFLPRWVPPGLG